MINIGLKVYIIILWYKISYDNYTICINIILSYLIKILHLFNSVHINTFRDSVNTADIYIEKQ